MSDQLNNNTVADGNTTTPEVEETNVTPETEAKTTPIQEEKTFTQVQVNAMIQERLTRERAKYEADREKIVFLERKLIALENGLPYKRAERYVKLALADQQEGEPFQDAMVRAIKEYPLKPGEGIPQIADTTMGAPLESMADFSRIEFVRRAMKLARKE